jgi:hypothetical protein
MPMAASSCLLDKLRALIVHDGTPATERQAALDRLERLLVGHDGTVRQRTELTRSARIGRQRRRLPIDEWARLEPYAGGLSLGECIGRLAAACSGHGVLPQRIDFGRHGTGDRPVIAVQFPLPEAPNPIAFAASVRNHFPGASVNVANQQAEGERVFLVYLPGRVADSS